MRTAMHTSGTRKNFIKISTAILLVVLTGLNVRAQITDSTKIAQEKAHNNIVKLNLTSWVLYTNGLQMSYERVLSPKRSFTIFGGIIQFPVPSSIANSSITFDSNKKRSGYSIGAEYRFYLAGENKYDAPHGVYLAPFISYYHFNNERGGRDTLNNDFVTLNSSIGFLNVGGEVGYQFVVKKRFVIDCVLFGPAISSYSFNVKLTGNISGDHSEQVQAIIDAIKNKYPLLNDLTKSEGVSSSGISDFWSLGFRYCIQVGYRF
jgi:hypothetical protein